MNKIYCLVVNGGSISPQTLNLILSISQRMIRNQLYRTETFEKESGVSIRIETEYKLSTLVTMTGFIFDVKFTHAKSKTSAKFIVALVDRDILKRLMRDGKWVKRNASFLKSDRSYWKN